MSEIPSPAQDATLVLECGGANVGVATEPHCESDLFEATAGVAQTVNTAILENLYPIDKSYCESYAGC